METTNLDYGDHRVVEELSRIHRRLEDLRHRAVSGLPWRRDELLEIESDLADLRAEAGCTAPPGNRFTAKLPTLLN